MSKVREMMTVGDLEFLSQGQAAKWMGVGRSTLIEWENEGLRVIRKGGRVWYSKTDIRKFLSQFSEGF